MRKIFRRINFKRLGENLLLAAPIITVTTVLFGLAIAQIFSDPYSDPSRAGTISCYPLGHVPNPNQRTQTTSVEETEENMAYYQGPFTLLERQDVDKVVFFDANRRKIQISNAACIVIFNEPEE